ncbi:MAG: hypothetical protein JW763_10755 [candidate division Zixibacteria bacterium]|nr:hypothetical protein [candidate division Zixibacteria bacterium]
MTRKLYQDDAYLFVFTAEVLECRARDNENEVILDATAFYPESGGQLYDLGSLDNHAVVNVYENDREQIIHLVQDGVFRPGQTVAGKIDQARRLDNMRKHTGQHILSQAFVRAADARTVSSHLSDIECTIELAREDLTPEDFDRVESAANDIVRQNLTVTTSWYDREQLQTMPIRKIPNREGRLRIVRIGDFDYTACGGTHCGHTGEIGLIKIIGSAKIRGHIRVTFLVGQPALTDYQQKHRTTAELSARLTCHHTDLVEVIERKTDQIISSRRETAQLRNQLFERELPEIMNTAEKVGAVGLVVRETGSDDMKVLKDQALKITGEYTAVAVLYADDKLLVASSKDSGLHAGDLIRHLAERHDLKGGGNPVLAQCGGIDPARMTDIVESTVQLIRERLDR